MINATKKYVAEVQERTARMVLDHERDYGSRMPTALSISARIGCAAQTLSEWLKKPEIIAGDRAGVLSEVAAKLIALERENRELRQANEVLRKVSACFAIAELDGPFKT